MNEHAVVINTLQPYATTLRDRQEAIDAKVKQLFAIISDLRNETFEQGRTIIEAKHCLGGRLSWSEWLRAHVPSLSHQQASKYERITTEQLEDPRQCLFAFLPPVEKDHVERMKPKPWERAWGFLFKFTRAAKIEEWPKEQIEYTRDALDPVVRKLYPEKFE